MESVTYLRRLRGRFRISLLELEAVSGLSNQYISKVELGAAPPTQRLEQQLSSALETIIAKRKKELLGLEEEYLSCMGRLLEPVEDGQNE